MKDPVTIKLSQPIHVVGEMRSELVLAEPNGGMIMRAGKFCKWTEDGMEPVPEGISKLIAASAKIPLRSVEELPAGDWMAAQMAVLSFLEPTNQERGPPTLEHSLDTANGAPTTS